MGMLGPVINTVEDLIKLRKYFSNIFGIIYKQAPAIILDKKGYLTWDYILFNEITFKDEDDNVYSLFKSWSDSETEKAWDELTKKYGV